jgi:hypothetical protein
MVQGSGSSRWMSDLAHGSFEAEGMEMHEIHLFHTVSIIRIVRKQPIILDNDSRKNKILSMGRKLDSKRKNL